MKQIALARRNTERGAILAFVALTMFVLLGMAALAIDVGYLHIVRGELQNAADAGALAGAQVLYVNDGQLVNAGANAVALNYVNQNFSESAAVSVVPGGIERGHWSFATRTFTPNDSLAPVDLWNVSTEELDANVNFINAVRVRTTRKTVNGQVDPPFFAGILGITGTPVAATAVAYIGFAGTLTPFEADEPIAICKQALLLNSEYSCSVGRMLNSDTGGGSGYDTYSGTGGWTDFNQPDQPWPTCEGGASSQPEVREAVCQGNSTPLLFGFGMSTTNGVVDTTFRQDFMDGCWKTTSSIDLYHIDGSPGPDGIPDQPWPLTLPVIDCVGGSPTSCSKVVGAVEVNVVWMIRNNPVGSDATNMTPQPEDTPRRMGDWSCAPGLTNRECWLSFVGHYNLQAPDGSPAIASKKTIYFLPSCVPHVPAGLTGGENFGILAKIPVLVQ